MIKYDPYCISISNINIGNEYQGEELVCITTTSTFLPKLDCDGGKMLQKPKNNLRRKARVAVKSDVKNDGE